jgi:exopolysaccharide production protein ExoQ
VTGASVRAGVRRGRSATWLEPSFALFGLLLCTGIPEAFAPSGFRLLKHVFYLAVIGLLLLRWQASASVARRDWGLWLLIAFLLSSALWSDEPAWALKRAAVMAQTTAFGLYLASRFSVGEQLRVFSTLIVIVLLAFAASALLDPVESFSTPGYDLAFRGPLPHKNEVARLMALAIPALLLAMGGGSPGRRWGMRLALAGAVLFLGLSNSLGGVLAAAMLCSVIALHRPAQAAGVWVVVIPPLAVLLGSLAAAGGLLDGLMGLLGKDPTLSSRTEIWSQSMQLVLERPLLGQSIASFWQQQIVETTGMWFPNAHNGYLELAIELGLVGLSLFLFQLSSTVVRSLAWTQLRDRAALWPYCIATFVLVYNLWEVATIQESSILWVLYVSASLAVRAPVPRRSQQRAALASRSLAQRGAHA